MTWIKKGILFNKEWAQLPVVDTNPLDHHTYRIYYSTRDKLGRSKPKFIDIQKNGFREFITDPKEIILPLGKPGSFDHYGIMPTKIITLEDGIKYFYYIGWSRRHDVPYHNSLGLAISRDNGLTWKKYSEGPIFTSSILEPGYIGTACVIKENQLWIMYYLSCREWIEDNGKMEPIYDIKQAISNDGIDWKPLNKTVIGLKENEGGVVAVNKIINKFYYSKRNKTDYRTNPKNSYKIYSCDLDGKSEHLELSPSGDEIMCAYPYVIEEADKYIMFYNSDFGKSGISYAIEMK